MSRQWAPSQVSLEAQTESCEDGLSMNVSTWALNLGPVTETKIDGLLCAPAWRFGEWTRAMLDFSTLPLLKPELLLSAEPLPASPPGPVRFAMGDWPDRERPTVLRECLARLGLRYEIERLRDLPFHVDFSLNPLPGLVMGMGSMHGSRNRRTRKHVEDSTDDAVLIVNLRGQHLIEQRDEELVLEDGEAALVSAADPSSFTTSRRAT
jgi:hypothetical protein